MSSTSRTPPPHRVPTLTEVVEFVDLTEPERPWERTERFVGPVAGAPGALPPVAANDDAALAERVLLDVQRQVDLMLEQRVRQALTPMLSRLAGMLVTELRTELASALRDMVARAVADELARQRAR